MDTHLSLPLHQVRRSCGRLSSLRLALLVGLLLIVTGCTAPQPGSAPAAPAENAASDDAVTIKLAENPWSASAANVAVAKILLEEELGYTVEVVNIGESAQWPALATGDLHASLEVWPSGHADNYALYIDDQGTVVDGGALGSVGKIGWYMPSYLLTEHPELATAAGLATAEAAALFATTETGNKGQFLTGDPSWTSYEEDVIRNLGMDFQIVAAGSEEAILAQLDGVYSREEPLLFYFWTPHWAHAKYDLTEVALPAYSAECYAKADSGGVDCGYPEDQLYKIFWSGLEATAPDAFALLSNLHYSTDDQISMIAAIDLDGKSPEEAARTWLADHEEQWRRWLPQ